MWLGGRRQLAKGDLPMLAVHVVFSTTARDLGLTLDQERNLSEYVNLITRSCYYQLRQLRVVLRSLSHEAAVVLVHAFVTSRIDHSCSVLVGLPLGLIGRLERFFDLLPALLVISPNMPRFLLTCVMSCTGFLSPNAICIGSQHLSGDL